MSKGPHFSSVVNYRPASKIPMHFKVVERPVSVRLWRFMERSGPFPFPTTQLVNRKGFGTCDCLSVCGSHYTEGISWEGAKG